VALHVVAFSGLRVGEVPSVSFGVVAFSGIGVCTAFPVAFGVVVAICWEDCEQVFTGTAPTWRCTLTWGRR